MHCKIFQKLETAGKPFFHRSKNSEIALCFTLHIAVSSKRIFNHSKDWYFQQWYNPPLT